MSRLHFIFDICPELTYLWYGICLIEILFLEVLIHLWVNFKF
jgi:hypothetical protein